MKKTQENNQGINDLQNNPQIINKMTDTRSYCQ